MLARKFYMCTVDVKIALFKAYCTSFYTSHLWCSYSKAKMKKLQVAFNDAFRILLKGIVHSKMKILSSFTHPQVVPNLYAFLCSAEHKGRYFEESL